MPFLALRSYLPPDHPDKAFEMGSEPTPGEFIDALLDVVEECRRVLATHGSLCVELGDTYSGSGGGGGGDYLPGGRRENQPGFGGSAERQRYGNAEHWRAKNAWKKRTNTPDHAWPLAKSLTLVPELFRIALVYGFNPLTGRTTEQWRARNVVRWCRPNPPVGALADKFRPATSEMVVACTSSSRYFDLDAVRTQPVDIRYRSTNGPKGANGDRAEVQTANYTERVPSNDAGAPPLDWWSIPTQPYPGAHYAAWPEKLLDTPIEAMCPTRVCTSCGEPSRRIVEKLNASGKASVRNRSMAGRVDGPTRSTEHPDHAITRTVGWTDCGCSDGRVVGQDPRIKRGHGWRPGVVLDPFAGSGTTLAVATGHGRDAIGIDLDARNADLARERVGMFLTVEDHRTGEVVA